MKTQFRAGLALASALVITLLFGACNRPEENINTNPFRQELDSELFLKVEGAREDRREVKYWPGTRTVKEIVVTYFDGGLQVSQYRKNGKVSHLTEWYPLGAVAATGTASDTGAGDTSASGNAVDNGAPASTGSGPTDSGKLQAEPQVKRIIEFGEDGFTVLKASFFRADGTRQAIGRLLADGQFHLLDYDVDGVTLAKQQVFERSGIPTFLIVRVGEPIKSVSRLLADGRMETTVFAENGVRLTRSLTNIGNSFEDIDFYKEDGRTRKFTVYRHYRISVVYYRADGSVDHFRSYDGEQMTVVQYRNGVAPKIDPDAYLPQPGEEIRQVFKSATVDGVETFVLHQIEEINEAGKVIRRIHLNASGQPSKVSSFDENGAYKKEVYIREDGTVSRITDYQRPANGPVITMETNLEAESNVRENVDPRLLQVLPHTDPRPLVGPPIQQPYYDYEGWMP